MATHATMPTRRRTHARTPARQEHRHTALAWAVPLVLGVILGFWAFFINRDGGATTTGRSGSESSPAWASPCSASRSRASGGPCPRELRAAAFGVLAGGAVGYLVQPERQERADVGLHRTGGRRGHARSRCSTPTTRARNDPAGPSGPTGAAAGSASGRRARAIPSESPRDRRCTMPSWPVSALDTADREGPMSTELAIETAGLVKTFGDNRAVDGVDLAVPAGTVYGVLGPNGAGKTTTVKMLATLLRPDGGEAQVFGHDVVREADDGPRPGQPHRPVRLGRRGPDRHGEPGAAGPAPRPLQAGRPGRAAQLLEAFGLSDAAGQAGEELLRRHAAPDRHRRVHPQHPRPALPRRADDRARPAQPQPGVGHRAGGRRAGHDGAC